MAEEEAVRGASFLPTTYYYGAADVDDPPTPVTNLILDPLTLIVVVF